MFSFLKRRAFLLFLGFLLIAVFIWYAGPYFAFGTYRPLEPELARLIAIALVVVVWIGSALLKRLRAYRASDKLVAAVLTQSHAETNKPSPEAVKLRERFEEAVATLQKQRTTGHSLYDLPWYVIIGAPGSGKTTALLNSGLKFPADQRLGKVSGVGGTRNCDWWFTDEAIFLDTAGRYTSQDSDAASDSAGWSEFLALLLKYRTRRPINGVILTISAQDLLTKDERGREGDIEAARRRLLELNRELHVQLPIYVMVTKCDLVAGFNEYFDDLAQEGRAQVWGVTFPYEQTLDGEAAQAFPDEFQALMARLNARVFARVEEDRDVQRRTKLFSFPQQMAALHDALVHFVSDVFASTRLDEPIHLRGVYFTSGTQDGTQIDRLLGSIGRRFGVAPGAVAPAGRGKAYFVERLLKEVLIGESGLAGVNRRLETKKAALQLGAYAAMALAAVLGIIVLSVSYSRNRTYIAEAASDVARVRQVPAVPTSASLEALLPRLDAMRAVVDSTNRYRDDRPWGMRWGLFQGSSIGNAARDAYLRELDGILLPRFAARVRQRLIEYGREPEKLYVYLKAYLMLGEPKHLDKAHLQFLADLEWKSADGAPLTAGDSASKHFQSLLEYSDTLRPIALDAALVTQARSTVRQASVPRIMYSRIQASYATDASHAVHLDSAAGIGGDLVFKRKSGLSLADPVPSLYSRPVFKEVTGRGTADLVKQFAEDNWVWGGDAVSVGNPVKLAMDVRDLYERDYINVWEGVLNDLELVPFATVKQTGDALGTLAGPASPLRGILRTVVDNTALVASAETAPPAGTLSSAGKTVTEGLGKILKPLREAAGVSTTPAGAIVSAHFQPIHRLMAGAPGSAPIDPILAKMGQIELQFKALGPEVGGGDPLEALGNPALRDLIKGLKDDAATLPPSVGHLIAQVGQRAGGSVERGANDSLTTRYQQQVLQDCKQVVSGRYPFAGGANEVPLVDFGRLFGYDGVFDVFFKENMEKLVDTDESPWKWRQEGVTAPQSMLDRFEAAARLRETFFRPGSSAPALRFTVTPMDLDAAATRFVIEIDGQRFDVGHNAPRKYPVQWPGSSTGEAIATFEDRSGAWPSQKYPGAWGWFRLIDDAQPQRESDLRLMLGFQNSGHQARVAVEATTIRNPFTTTDWKRFNCGS